MSVLAGMIAYHRTFGPRGILAIAAYRLFRVPREIVTLPPESHYPVTLRLRTTDIATYRGILLDAEYSFDLEVPPKVIIDAGANIGMASIYFAQRYPEAKIIAVEAEASNFSMLTRNVSHYPAITPVHAARWNRDGQISVGQPNQDDGRRGNWSYITHEGQGTKVRAITMRTLMQEMGIEVIDLAKIDIEGAEREMFEDDQWLASTRYVMIELHDRFRPGCTEAIDPAMKEFAQTQRGETLFFARQS